MSFHSLNLPKSTSAFTSLNKPNARVKGKEEEHYVKL